jgi:hypothetical protein
MVSSTCIFPYFMTQYSALVALFLASQVRVCLPVTFLLTRLMRHMLGSIVLFGIGESQLSSMVFNCPDMFQ